MKTLLTSLLALVALTGFTHLPEMKTAQPRPPQAAIDACAQKQEGQSCIATVAGRTEEGICRTPPGQRERACIPNRMGGQSGAREMNRGPGPAQGQQAGQRGGRRHITVQSNGDLDLYPATVPPITHSRVTVRVEGDCRIIAANGISEHDTGPFPNAGNPSRITEQQHEFCVPANPRIASQVTPLGLGKFGVGVNGVPFDPGAAEFYLGDMNGGWRYEALSGAISLGLDANYAHVQPGGTYHYHGLPTLHLQGTGLAPGQHSPLIGWAADGFPIYALYGFGQNGVAVIQVTSSYRLKQGTRPTGANSPGGVYDGTFVSDYEYIEGLGTLDECNGRVMSTPEFPEGTYAYYLTPEWPVIPRCYKGTPSDDFVNLGPGGRPLPR
ncbi:MAG: YHYH protein [Aquisalinus sp.]|nr:YHYH protein [Aquisalinus sp.]